MLELIIFIRDIQAIALSHLIVLNSPLEDIGAYAFQRKLGFLLSDVFLNEVAKFRVGVGYRYGVIVVCHRYLFLSESSAYASPTLRLWYAYGTNHIFESRFFPFSSCSKFGMNSRMASTTSALDGLSVILFILLFSTALGRCFKTTAQGGFTSNKVI